ncbi:hypothetical protein IWZ01DRAFT_99358 [Phyllosticta capitalensis]
MSALPDTTPAVPVPAKEEASSTTTDVKERKDSKDDSADIEKLLEAKAKEDPLHVTKEDAARLESAEHKALGHRPPSGSVASHVQSLADKVENFHKVADPIEEKLREHPSSVTKEEAQQVLSKEHKVLGHYPPKDSISAELQRVATANEKEASKNGDSEKVISKEDSKKDDDTKPAPASDKAETGATRRTSSVDKTKADQFKAKALDVVIKEAKEAFQKELEDQFKTGEGQSLEKEAANNLLAEKTEEIEARKAEVEDVTAVPANGEAK